MEDPILDVTLDVGASTVQILLLACKLELATAFGTSHSSTSFRNNALLVLKLDGIFLGIGEAGLPPKKLHVYEADMNDCKEYVLGFIESIHSTKKQSVVDPQKMFEHLPDCYFSCFRSTPSNEAGHRPVRPIFPLLLQALDNVNCTISRCSFGRAGRSLVESTILSACAHDCRLTTQELIGVPLEAPSHLSFYTAALNEDISLIVQAAKFGAQFTPQLKIKLNGDVDMSRRILKALDAALPATEGHHWSIDANCGWSPEVALCMLKEVLGPYTHRIFMVEQPFPVDIVSQAQDPEVARQWRGVKSAFNSADMLLFADESMRTCDDVVQLEPFVNGVNIKLEKCGGFIAALRAVEEARRHALHIWFGCMVGSNVNSTTTAQLFSLACASDLDGALLVTPGSQLFEGGFSYTKPNGNLSLFSDEIGFSHGIGVVPKDLFATVYCQKEE